MIACQVGFVEQRAGGSQGSSVWLVQLVLHRLCSNEQTLLHPFSLAGCQGCCKLSFLPKRKCFIPQRPGLAQSAAAEMRGDGWCCNPTLFHWQSMRAHAELHQQPQSGNGHWNLKIWHSLQLTGAQKPSKVCAELGPLKGSCSWGDMQTTPNLFELTLHVCLKPEGVQACNNRR